LVGDISPQKSALPGYRRLLESLGWRKVKKKNLIDYKRQRLSIAANKWMGYAVKLQDMQCSTSASLAVGFPILAKRFYHIFKAEQQ